MYPSQDKEYQREYQKKYHLKNRVRILARNAEYYAAHKAERAEEGKRYRQSENGKAVKAHWARNYLIKNREKVSEYHKKWSQTDKGKESTKKSLEKHLNSHPGYFWARNKLRNAVRDGRVLKQSCSKCGLEKSEAHHYLGYDGEHWKDVMWLCHKHHMIEHGRWLGDE